mgnify:CR=1 FL=1
MKINQRILYISVVLILISVISCKKKNPVTLTIFGESTISEITSNSAKVEGVTLEIGEDMQVYGHVWGETATPDISSNLKSEHTTSDPGSFTDELWDLKPETTSSL